jgi:hypothetical protein
MAEEAEASLRYFQMRFRVRGAGRRKAERFFEEALKETLDHANEVAAQIKTLGFVPKLRIVLTLGGGPIQAADALAEALDVEQQALTAYEEFLPRVGGHPQLKAFKFLGPPAPSHDGTRRDRRAVGRDELVLPSSLLDWLDWIAHDATDSSCERRERLATRHAGVDRVRAARVHVAVP